MVWDEAKFCPVRSMRPRGRGGLFPVVTTPPTRVARFHSTRVSLVTCDPLCISFLCILPTRLGVLLNWLGSLPCVSIVTWSLYTYFWNKRPDEMRVIYLYPRTLEIPASVLHPRTHTPYILVACISCLDDKWAIITLLYKMFHNLKTVSSRISFIWKSHILP